MIIQIIVVLFILFAVSRVFLRFKEKSITLGEFFVWTFIWLAIGVVVLLPHTASLIAHFLGVGRGADAIIYLSLIVLFYGLFRIYVKLEFIEHEITQVVRKIALNNKDKDHEDHPRQ